MEPPFKSIAIVGLGLIGGSIAAAVRQRWPDVDIAAVDVASVVSDAAVQRITPRVVSASDEAAALALASSVDLTVLAVPVGLIERLAPTYLDVAKLLTDCGSTKGTICERVADHPRRAAFVAGHPMAGAPHGGFQHAKADLFVGRPWLLCPPPPDKQCDAGRAAHDEVQRFAAALGAHPLSLPAAAHDAAVAITSHLPQLLASHLVLLSGSHGADFAAGPGFDSTTRVAGGNRAMWRDIFRSNAPAVAAAARELAAQLNQSAAALESGTIDEVVAVLDAARDARSPRP